MIDVTKCIGCRKGIAFFEKRNGIFYHLDILATAEAGALYECTNTPDLEPLVSENKNGMYMANEEFKEFMAHQEWWFEDIIDLAHDLFDNKEDVTSFFYNDVDGKSMIESTNEIIESSLLAIASQKNFSVTEDDYPDLLIYKK
jgi:hypothetical protein